MHERTPLRCGPQRLSKFCIIESTVPVDSFLRRTILRSILALRYFIYIALMAGAGMCPGMPACTVSCRLIHILSYLTDRREKEFH